MIYPELFLAFLRVGCFTFGGAYAAIPLIRDAVLEHGWLTEERLAYMIAVSESTPGPIMVNLATYVGSSQAGLLGAVLATLAVVLPSFCIILLIFVVMKKLIRDPRVKAMLGGMQPAIIGIILATGVQMTISGCMTMGSVDWKAVVIAVILAAVVLVMKKKGKKISAIRLILLSAVLGIAAYGLFPIV